MRKQEFKYFSRIYDLKKKKDIDKLVVLVMLAYTEPDDAN